MTWAERRLLGFIGNRLERMLRAPGMWGSNESVELQVLQLLELRLLILSPSTQPRLWRRAQRDYIQFVGREFPGQPPETLASLVERAGREGEFACILGRFVAEQVGRVRIESLLGDRASEEPDEASEERNLRESRAIEEVFEAGARAGVASVAGRRHQRGTRAINFPEEAGSDAV